jgi:uncharacterized protein YkwD
VRVWKWGTPVVVVVLWLALAPGAHAAPRAVIVSGPPASTAETTATFTFAASRSGGLFNRFECSLDGGAWATCGSPRRIEGLSGGAHSFAVRLTGLFTDPTPATAGWVVEALTVTTPKPVVPRGKPPRRRSRDVAGCANAAAYRAEVSARVLAGATLCLLNHERRKRGLRALRVDGRLAAAAGRHAADMVANRYFAHVSPSGTTLSQRIARTGYLSNARYWAVGEVLAWTSQRLSSPRIAVRALMRSAAHRRLIVDPTFTEAGVAVVKHAPVRGVRRGATFVANFGRLTF